MNVVAPPPLRKKVLNSGRSFREWVAQSLETIDYDKTHLPNSGLDLKAVNDGTVDGKLVENLAGVRQVESPGVNHKKIAQNVQRQLEKEDRFERFPRVVPNLKNLNKTRNGEAYRPVKSRYARNRFKSQILSYIHWYDYIILNYR